MFIDTKVGQVNKPLADVLLLAGVLIGGESHQPIFEQVYSQRVIAGHYHVDPQVVLQIVDQVRIIDVLRYQILLSVTHFGGLGYHSDSATTRSSSRFHYPQVILIGVLSCHFEPVEVARQQVGHRNKIVGLGMHSLNFVDSSPEKIFAPDVPTTWKMTDFLMLAHILQLFGLIAFDVKINVPLRTTLASFKPIVLQRVYYALVLPSVYFVPHLSPLQREYQSRIELVGDVTDSRILEKYSCRPALESAPLQINLTVLVFTDCNRRFPLRSLDWHRTNHHDRP